MCCGPVFLTLKGTACRLKNNNNLWHKTALPIIKGKAKHGLFSTLVALYQMAGIYI